MDLDNVTEVIPIKTLREWRKFFGQRGTKILLQKETGISRSSLRTILQKKSARMSTIERIESFISQFSERIEA